MGIGTLTKTGYFLMALLTYKLNFFSNLDFWLRMPDLFQTTLMVMKIIKNGYYKMPWVLILWRVCGTTFPTRKDQELLVMDCWARLLSGLRLFPWVKPSNNDPELLSWPWMDHWMVNRRKGMGTKRYFPVSLGLTTVLMDKKRITKNSYTWKFLHLWKHQDLGNSEGKTKNNLLEGLFTPKKFEVSP